MITLNGQPRSKTSMMMRILEMGGVPCEYGEYNMDRVTYRNPHGFFEIRKPTFTKCHKSTYPLNMTRVPKTNKIIFIQRDLDQQIKSWQNVAPTILQNGQLVKVDHATRCTNMRKKFEDGLEGYNYLKIKTEDMLENPRRECERIKEFIKDEVDFDVEKAITAIDHSLTVIR